MKPAPCSFTPGEQRPLFASRGAARVRSAPTLRSLLIRPSRLLNSRCGSSPSSAVSATISRRTPSPRPACATVMATRTAAASGPAGLPGDGPKDAREDGGGVANDGAEG